MHARISSPLEWPAPALCRILDLREQHYDGVLRLIKRHFFAEDPMCKSAQLLRDEISTQNYLELIKFWIKDTTSLVALSTRSERVVGVVVGRINWASERSIIYSRMRVVQGEILNKLMHLTNTLVKQADAYNRLKHEVNFRMYILCVHPSYRKKGLKSGLLQAFIRMAIALEIPAVVGTFTSEDSQELASSLGFKMLSEIRYSRWIFNNTVVLDNPGIGNYSAAFMGMLTPSLEQWRSLQAREIARENEENPQQQLQ